MSLEIRRIRPDEGLRLRALRLRALADAPMAFGSTLAREEAFPDRIWHERAAGGAGGDERVTFIAERDGQWIGLATGLADALPGRPNPSRIPRCSPSCGWYATYLGGNAIVTETRAAARSGRGD